MDNCFKGKMSSNIKEFFRVTYALCAEGAFVQRQEKAVFFDWILG